MSERSRLLLVENSQDFVRAISMLLELEGYCVEVASSPEEAERELSSSRWDLAIIDLRLTDDSDMHDMSGLEVAKKAGELGVPCIIETAFPSVASAVVALRARHEAAYAVDYVPKVGGPQVLLDSIALALKRHKKDPVSSPRGLRIDLEKQLVFLDERDLPLSRQQYKLLAFLYERAGAVCSFEDLIGAVYNEQAMLGDASRDRRLERLVARIREKIEEDPACPKYLINVPGRGFRLDLSCS